jgi:DNA-binding MarR family transcriptional regulator
VRPSPGGTHAPAEPGAAPPEEPLISEQGEPFAVQGLSAAAARLAAKDEQVRKLERREPLQRQVLEALAEQGCTPTELAERIAAPKESVARQLSRLAEQGLVGYRPVPGDGRKRHYELTAGGEVQLAEHRAFGAPGAPPEEPGEEEVAGFLLAALRAAVALRRKTRKLEEVELRLQRIVAEAGKAGAHAVALEARAELVTTLRQAGHLDRAAEVLADIESISQGQALEAGTAVVPAAIAHREYALGVHPGRVKDRAARARHLVFASELYEQFVQTPPFGTAADWRERRAWSLIALANNLRGQSLFEGAMRASGEALRLFEELEDAYGRSRCLFTFGFCLRLLGDHANAWVYLEDSHALAAEHGFERFQADSLMQMGEVHRCQGRLEDALELLSESEQRARNLSFTVTQGFALSALGAVHYQRHDLQRSVAALQAAQRLFTANKHPEGAALNARRHATVARGMARLESERREVAELAADACRRYWAIGCPAGVAAAEIEHGYLRLTGRGDPAEIAARLTKHLADPRQRDLIEYDACVPRVLHSFAVRVDDDGTLKARVAELLEAGQRRAQEARAAIRETIASIGAHAGRLGPAPPPPSELAAVDEMGGESRHFATDRSREPVCF